MVMVLTDVEVVLRKWGNSLGLTLPKGLVKKQGLREGKAVRIDIREPLKKPKPGAFGCMQGWKIDPQQVKDELRKEHER